MKHFPVVLAVLAGGFYLCANPALGQGGAGRGARTPAVNPPPQAQKGPGSRGANAAPRPAKDTKPVDPARMRQQTRVATELRLRPQLASRLGALLPAGMPLEDAATGFRNQGQFIAALHVSQNLNIPFADLKARMTGEDSLSLGRAIQQLRPELERGQVQEAVKLAETQAKEDVREGDRAVKTNATPGGTGS